MYPSSRKRRPAIAALALLALIFMPLIARADDDGQVLPPWATPHGYSLDDMASAMALYSTSGNNPTYLPDTPFAILGLDPSSVMVTGTSDGGLLVTGDSSFTVEAGTTFFVPIYYTDDSPPIIGDFPDNAFEALFYFFGPQQLGFTGGAVWVDGRRTDIGPFYLAGPVQVPNLLDGTGTHYMQLGFFLSPLSPGQHTIVVEGKLAGTAFTSALGLAYESAVLINRVTVTPHRH